MAFSISRRAGWRWTAGAAVFLAVGVAMGVARSGSRASVPTGLRAYRDLAYARRSPAEALDLYIPQGAGPFPLVVWIHGGGWSAGDKALGPSDPQAGLLGRGYAVASINYRLTGEAPWPAQIFDCKAAIKWLRAHSREYALDPSRIGVWGGSAGGHLVTLLAATNGVPAMEDPSLGNPAVSADVRCAVDWFGPTDFAHFEAQQAGSPQNDRDYAMRAITAFVGGDPHKATALLRAASPITYASRKVAPILIEHGDRDPIVPVAQSRSFRDALVKAGNHAELIILPGAAHGGPAFSTPENVEVVYRFLDARLKHR